MAQASPTGIATRRAKNTTMRVPTTIGHTPKLGVANAGAHVVPVMNSRNETSWKNPMVG
jgi:hypothetical protein